MHLERHIHVFGLTKGKFLEAGCSVTADLISLLTVLCEFTLQLCKSAKA